MNRHIINCRKHSGNGIACVSTMMQAELDDCHCHHDCPGYTKKKLYSPLGEYSALCLCYPMECEHCKKK